MNDPSIDEFVRQQLTPLVVPVVQRLQSAQKQASDTETTVRALSAEVIVLRAQLAETRNDLGCIAKQLAVALGLVEELLMRLELMFRIPPEPHLYWRGVLLGTFMGTTLGLTFILYLFSR